MSTYEVDGRDRLVGIPGLPQSASAPQPFILSDEASLFLGYVVQPFGEQLRDLSTHAGITDFDAELLAIVQFVNVWSYISGAPNDESMNGHPLASRGLLPYSAFEVQESSWTRRLEQLNRVHPQHSPARFSRLRHFVLCKDDLPGSARRNQLPNPGRRTRGNHRARP